MATVRAQFRRLAAFDIVDQSPALGPSILTEIGFGLLCLSAAFSVRLAVDRVAPIAGPYTLLFPVILISTLFGRWRSGLTTYLVGFAWAWFLVLPHTLGHKLSRETDASRLLLNAAAALVILVFAEVFRRATRISAAERDAALADLSDREARMRLALDAGRLGSWTLDVNSRNLTTSASCRLLFGRERDDLFTYVDLLNSVHEDDRGRMQTAEEQSIRSQTPYDIEYRIVTPEGELRWVQIRAETIVSQGSQLCLTGVSIDITDRKRADARRDALAMLSEAFRDTADSSQATSSASRIVGEALGLTRVGYGVITPDLNAIEIDRDWTSAGTDQFSGQIPVALFASRGEALMRGEQSRSRMSEAIQGREAKQRLWRPAKRARSSMLGFLSKAG